jgi:hypothetical protein
MRYIEEHFLKYVPRREDDPILLLLDGHKSHTSVGLVDWVITHNIINACQRFSALRALE